MFFDIHKALPTSMNPVNCTFARSMLISFALISALQNP